MDKELLKLNRTISLNLFLRVLLKCLSQPNIEMALVQKKFEPFQVRKEKKEKIGQGKKVSSILAFCRFNEISLLEIP